MPQDRKRAVCFLDSHLQSYHQPFVARQPAARTLLCHMPASADPVLRYVCLEGQPKLPPLQPIEKIAFVVQVVVDLVEASQVRRGAGGCLRSVQRLIRRAVR